MKSGLHAFTVILCFNAASLVFSAFDAPKSVCTFNKDSGPCLAYFKRYFFNPTSGQCETFVYGGCQGNGNRFATLEACENTCSGLPKACYLPKKVGPCRVRFPRYYYNKDTEQCEFFTYGGCKGNKNNFKTLKQCNHVCQGDRLPKRCYLPKMVGPCKALYPRYYYNKDTKKCEFFTYGGCKGNKNNFKTLKQCNRVCH